VPVENTNNKFRGIKSFVLRQGRLTKAQQNALDNYWQDYGIEYSELEISFKELFDNDSNTIIEIGFGNGDSLLEQVVKQQDSNFIGIEVHGPGVGHLIHNAHSGGVKNIKIIRHDAVEVLNNQIADESVSQLQLFFPDPWHKKKHHKRRIINPDFVQLVRKKLKTGGIFHMATDWQHYAVHMLEQMDNADGFINTSGRGQYSMNKGDRCETKFERRGLKLGHGVWDLLYKKS
jgi:tRNA (guanine-N7-)-methyltransferase